MLKFGNKEFRNLQEQVKKNMDDIMFILQEEGVLNEFGIKVVGQESSVLDMPTVEQYKEDNPDWSFGDAYAIGTEAPYELYILTRANGTHPDDYWFNIGEFPVPGPQGEEGPAGPQGPQGQTGPSGADGLDAGFGTITATAHTLDPEEEASVSVNTSGPDTAMNISFEFGIPKGQDGSAMTSVQWGEITGTLSNQTDLVSAFQTKANVSTLSSYATQVYADNVANDAKYQAGLYTDSAISGLSSVYATQSAMSSAISALDYLSVGALSAATVIPTKVSELDNDTGFITSSALSEYATEAFVGSAISSATTDMATQTWVGQQGYLTSSALSEYATTSDLSSAISGVNSTISSLNYASVGALSASTFIPSVYGSNDGTNWTNLTINGSTYGFAAGGSVTGAAMLSESNTFTSYNKFNSTTYFGGSVTLALGVSKILSVGNSVGVGGNANFWCPVWFRNSSAAPMLEYGQLRAYGDGNVGTCHYTLPQLSGTIALTSDIPSLSEYATISQVSSAISALDYASVGALSAETVIPDITGLASETYVNDSISALSSVYQPVGEYARLSSTNLFTKVNQFNSHVSIKGDVNVGTNNSET